MSRRARALLILLGTGALLLAGVVVEAGAHVDGCHRWHSCPSDDGGYVCGDRGHCNECADNQYCVLGRPRGAASTATRPPRPTRTAEPTEVPRLTRTAEVPAAGRSGDSGAPARAEAAAEPGRAPGVAGGTGAPLGAAAGPRAAGGGGPSPAGSPIGTAAGASSPLPELLGVRVVQPARWLFDADGGAAEVIVANGGSEGRTVLLIVTLHDGQGERVVDAETILGDLAPAEVRTILQRFPPLATTPSEVRVRLEPLLP